MADREHEPDCPARHGCCPNDEYGCVIHAEPPCNCAAVCPRCDGAAELTRCANDGTHGCSHQFDQTWPCPDCDGTGIAQPESAG